MENETRNQHFLPRVEQKLNALNPKAGDRNLRIYSFRLVDRDTYSIVLEEPRGRSIDRNLSLFDLFSFDVSRDRGVRANLESLFHKYETYIELHTRSLLDKIDANTNDIKAEIIDLFAAKLLNFIRNPFCVQKVLNTFPGIATYHPTDPALLESYHRIADGQKPHQTYLCRQLGISDAQYVEWLRVLFMLLMQPGNGHPSLYESLIKSLIEDRKMYGAAFLFQYDGHRCLLSDRGYCQPLPDGERLSFSFNLCSTTFITYIFDNPREILKGKASPEFLDYALAAREQLPAQFNVTPMRNHMPMLAQYNRRVIEQCHERVYCSAKDGIFLG